MCAYGYMSAWEYIQTHAIDTLHNMQLRESGESERRDMLDDWFGSWRSDELVWCSDLQLANLPRLFALPRHQNVAMVYLPSITLVLFEGPNSVDSSHKRLHAHTTYHFPSSLPSPYHQLYRQDLLNIFFLSFI